MIASALWPSSAGAIFLFVPLFVLQLFAPQVSLNSSAPIGQDGQDGHGLVSLLGGDDDPKYLECKSRLDGDASAIGCSTRYKPANVDAQYDLCHEHIDYDTCLIPIACNVCTHDSAGVWLQVRKQMMDTECGVQGACHHWASDCPHQSTYNCPTIPTTTPTTSPSTLVGTTAAPFPLWILMVVILVIVLIIAALVLYLVLKPNQAKKNAVKPTTTSTRLSGKRTRERHSSQGKFSLKGSFGRVAISNKESGLARTSLPQAQKQSLHSNWNNSSGKSTRKMK